MYLAIDVGGTKTLLAVFDETGHSVVQQKIATPKSYEAFAKSLKKLIGTEFDKFKFKACCCALPAEVDRQHGIGLAFGNLSWHNVPILRDLKKIVGDIPIYIENDAKLAGLSEAKLLHKKYHKVLYLTISTGIGDGIIIDDKIDMDFADSEAGQMVLEHDGKLQRWEDFASGRALVERYGKKASEIDDPVIWEAFANNLARGINELLATLQPDIVIIGGGVGAHYEKFSEYLNASLKSMENDLVDVPPIVKAARPEEAVIYGCYEFLRQDHD